MGRVKRTSRPQPNVSERPRGFSWPRDQRVYHATLALDRVLREGLKPRAALGRDIHATGGGPDESVSFTTDKRVAFAIAIGLRTLARAARGELQLGQLIIELERLAPKGVAQQIASMRLTPENVVHIDSGLVPFAAGYGAWQNVVSLEAFHEADPHDLHAVQQDFAGGSKPFAVRGWAAPRVVERMQEASRQHGRYEINRWIDRYAADQKFEFYKYMLSYAEWDRELYNPLFLHTSPEAMAPVTDEQLGVVAATLGADWLCTDSTAAVEMGFDTQKLSPVYLSDWASGCEDRLRRDRERPVSLPTNEWAQPDRRDTIWFTRSMSEIRVYDTTLIRDLHESYNMDDVIHEVRDAWSDKGRDVEDPLAHPFFKPRQPHLAR